MITAALSTSNTPAVNAYELQAAINIGVGTGEKVLLPHGAFFIDGQALVTAGPGVRFGFDMEGEGPGTVLKPIHTGSAVEKDTAGFLFLIDGMRDSHWRNFQIDFSESNGGIVGRCRNESLWCNTFSNISYTGGTQKSDRETNDRRSFKIIGNEPEAHDPNYAAYFNIDRDCKYNTAYKHIEYVNGGAASGTDKPNANQSYGGLFERYIIAVDHRDADECRIDVRFMQQGQGVPGINGGYTVGIKTNGYGTMATGQIEPGTNGKSIVVGADARKSIIDLFSNTAAGFDVLCGPDNSIRINGEWVRQGISSGAPAPLRAYSVAGLPPAADYKWCFAYVTNHGGGQIPAFSDGSNWRRCDDRAVI